MASSDANQHHRLLKLHCRLCGQKRVENNVNKGVTIKGQPQLCRWLRYLHDLEVERESEEIYPTRACDPCINRLRNVSICHKGTVKRALENVYELATKLFTAGQDDELRKLSREFPAADFWAHSSAGMCAICDDSIKDSFPSIDFASHILIEIEEVDGVLKIFKASKTSKPVVPKRDLPAKEETNKANDKSAPQVKEAKKPRIEAAPSSSTNASNSQAITTAKVSSISSGQAWLQFIEALGRNRRARCDKLAELLKWSNMDNPKVLSDLKSSGLTFKILPTRHTTPNVEFKSTLAKCKRLLTAFPAAKRTLMLFRSITDTVTDGRTDLMTHVGIHINLEHANLAFLKRKIQTKKAELKEQERIRNQKEQQEQQRATRAISAASSSSSASSATIHTRNKATKEERNTSSANANPKIPKLPSGITISKVKHADQPLYKAEPNIKTEGPMLIERPEEPDGAGDNANEPDTITINEAKVRRAVADIEKKHLPANRQMKTDVIFDCLHLRADTSALLADHGIIYNPKLGKHHLRVLSGQRKVHKNAIIKATENMNKYEWAAVMAQLVFGLLHTEDTLTLRVAGLMIDPFHQASPLSFRMGFMLKHLLISQDDPGLSRNLLSHILRSCEVDPQTHNSKEIENALVQLLYCDPVDAKNLVASVKKPVKISLKSAVFKGNNAKIATTTKPPVNQKLSKAGRPTRKVVYTDEPYEAQAKPVASTTTTRGRGRPSIKTEIRDEDEDYVPGRKPRSTRNSSNLSPVATTSSALPLSPSPKKRGPRGKYKKSQQQLQKEQLREKQLETIKQRQLNRRRARMTPDVPWQQAPETTAATSIDPNVLVEVNADMLDPLAMPDPSFVNPMDVSIKTEVIDDELPVTGIGAHPEAPEVLGDIHHGLYPQAEEVNPDGDVSNLLIASVTGNIEDIGMESPSHHSSSSLDIDHNPIQEDPFSTEKTPEDQPPIVDDVIPEQAPEPEEQHTQKLEEENNPLATTNEMEISKPPSDEEDANKEQEIHDPCANGEVNENDESISNEEVVNNGLKDVEDKTNTDEAATDDGDDDPLASLMSNDKEQGAPLPLYDSLATNGVTTTTERNNIDETIHSEYVEEPLAQHNGNNGNNVVDNEDPFASMTANEEDDLHALLESNPLDNGDVVGTPTLLEDEANDLLDHLVGFPLPSSSSSSSKDKPQAM